MHRIIAKYVRAKSVLRGLQKFIWLQKVMWEEEKQRPSASGIAIARGNDVENFVIMRKTRLFQPCLHLHKMTHYFHLSLWINHNELIIMIKVMLTMTIIPSIFIIKIKINLLIHYYYLSLGSNPLSLSLTELPNSSTSPQFKANPSVQSMMIRMITIVMALLRMITILMILMVMLLHSFILHGGLQSFWIELLTINCFKLYKKYTRTCFRKFRHCFGKFAELRSLELSFTIPALLCLISKNIGTSIFSTVCVCNCIHM